MSNIAEVFDELRSIAGRPYMKRESFHGCFLTEENAKQSCRPLWQSVVRCPKNEVWCVVDNQKAV